MPEVGAWLIDESEGSHTRRLARGVDQFDVPSLIAGCGCLSPLCVAGLDVPVEEFGRAERPAICLVVSAAVALDIALVTTFDGGLGLAIGAAEVSDLLLAQFALLSEVLQVLADVAGLADVHTPTLTRFNHHSVKLCYGPAVRRVSSEERT